MKASWLFEKVYTWMFAVFLIDYSDHLRPLTQISSVLSPRKMVLDYNFIIFLYHMMTSFTILIRHAVLAFTDKPVHYTMTFKMTISPKHEHNFFSSHDKSSRKLNKWFWRQYCQVIDKRQYNMDKQNYHLNSTKNSESFVRTRQKRLSTQRYAFRYACNHAVQKDNSNSSSYSEYKTHSQLVACTSKWAQIRYTIYFTNFPHADFRNLIHAEPKPVKPTSRNVRARRNR